MRYLSKFLAAAGFSFLLTACASTNPYQQAAEVGLLADAHFAGFDAVEIPSAEQIFFLEHDIRSKITQEVTSHNGTEKRMLALLTKMIGEPGITVGYDLHANSTASETYKKREANCLSLSIMGYAMARESGLKVQFQKVHTPEYWVPLRGYSLNTTHVNLVIEADDPKKLSIGSNDTFELDFAPDVSEAHFRREQLSENQVIALFYANIAVEQLMAENFISSYALLRKSLELDPSNGHTWVNLGVLYRRAGLDQLAVDTYHYAINQDKKNLGAATNYITLLESQGRGNEVKELKLHVANKRKNNPYYHAYLAQIAFQNANYPEARRLYRKAISLDARVHEFYFGLANSHYAMGNIEHSKRSMQRAHKLADFPRDRYRYNNKLAFLNGLSG